MKYIRFLTLTAIMCMATFPGVGFANQNSSQITCAGKPVHQECTWYVDASGKVWSVGGEGRVERKITEDPDCSGQGNMVDGTKQGDSVPIDKDNRCGIAYFSTDLGAGGTICGWKTTLNCGAPGAKTVQPSE